MGLDTGSPSAGQSPCPGCGSGIRCASLHLHPWAGMLSLVGFCFCFCFRFWPICLCIGSPSALGLMTGIASPQGVWVDPVRGAARAPASGAPGGSHGLCVGPFPHPCPAAYRLPAGDLPPALPQPRPCGFVSLPRNTLFCSCLVFRGEQGKCHISRVPASSLGVPHRGVPTDPSGRCRVHKERRRVKNLSLIV